MKRRRVEFSPEARRDLVDIYEWIAEQAGESIADSYLERIFNYCRGFDIASERGTKRDDCLPGLRITGFERRVTIAFVVESQAVVILRLFYAGRDWEKAFKTEA